MQDIFAIAAELRIAQQRLQSVPEYEQAGASILAAWADRNFEECVRIIDRYPVSRVQNSPIRGCLAEAMVSFDTDLILRLIDLRLFVAVPTADVPHDNVWTSAVTANRLDVMRTLWSHRGRHPIGTKALTAALSYAARESYRSDMIAWLVQVGADINSVAAEDRFKYVHPLTFALHDAMNVGTEHTVRALLDLGADPNHRDSEGGVPLVWAACYGDLSKVRALLSYGAYAPSEMERADFWAALELAPEDCVEEIRRSSRSREMGQMLAVVLGRQPDSSGGTSGGPGPL